MMTTTSDGQATDGGRRRSAGRSPNYPGLSLKKAVERIAIIHEAEGRHWTNMATLVNHLGFKTMNSGPATVTYAGLKKFGLLDEEGTGDQRRARVSELAYRILKAPEPKRSEAIKEAALLPAIHQEMRRRFPDGLPSDANLLWQLETDLNFTPSGAADFLRKYRATVDYARLDSSDGSRDDDDEDDESGAAEDGQEDQEELPPRRKPKRGLGIGASTLTIPVPIIGGETVTVSGNFPITEAAWAQFMAVLSAMKPGLVQAPEPEDVE
jgi:hypothetical protein